MNNPWDFSNLEFEEMQTPSLMGQRPTETGAVQNYGKSTNYPTFTNAVGIGSQNPLNNPKPPAPPMGNSQGGNPWTLSGDANSR
jgi:hypothetical protein